MTLIPVMISFITLILLSVTLAAFNLKVMTVPDNTNVLVWHLKNAQYNDHAL